MFFPENKGCWEGLQGMSGRKLPPTCCRLTSEGRYACPVTERSESPLSLLGDFPNCQCLVLSPRVHRGLLESAGSSVVIRRDQGGDTQRTPARDGLRPVRPPALIPGAQTPSGPAPLVNHLASWSFSSLASSVRHQKPFRKSNPKPLLTVAQDLPSGRGEGSVRM